MTYHLTTYRRITRCVCGACVEGGGCGTTSLARWYFSLRAAPTARNGGRARQHVRIAHEPDTP